MTYMLHERDAEKRGEAIGKEVQARETARNFYAMGASVEDIAKGVGYTVDTVKRWLNIIPS